MGASNAGLPMVVRVLAPGGVTMYVYSSDVVFHHVTANVVADMHGEGPNVYAFTEGEMMHMYVLEASVMSSLPEQYPLNTIQLPCVHIYVQQDQPAGPTAPSAAVE